jgi:hypothetical protein
MSYGRHHTGVMNRVGQTMVLADTFVEVQLSDALDVTPREEIVRSADRGE